MRSRVAVKLLLHDRSTTAGAILGVIAIVFLVGQQYSVLFGLFNFMSALVDHSGADIWICSQNTNNINSSGLLPIRYIDRIIGLPGVEWAEPVISGGGSVKRKDGQSQPVQVVGLPRPALPGGPWRFNQGSLEVLLDYEGITIDKLDLRNFGNPALGDIIEVNEKRVRIAGLTQNVRGFQGTLVYTNIRKAREITNLPADRCSFILVKVKPGISVASAILGIKQILPKAEAFSSKELSRNTRTYYVVNTGIGSSIGFSVLVGALVGIVIITLTMYTAVLNRQKDFAVLRAIGGRRGDILIIVIFQTLFIVLAGMFLGFLLLAGFLSGVRETNLPTGVIPMVVYIHAILTLIFSFAGSLFAMRRAVRVEPASVFR
jgi:putative ABC transport system permease protein